MRALLLPCLITGALLGAAPLAVVQVVRQGLPPYEDNARLYRLEGEGWELRPGRVVLLVRPGDRRSLGQLEVVSAGQGFALARLLKAGATFPMKGDLAVPREPLRTPPAMPRILPDGAAFPRMVDLAVPRGPLQILPGLPGTGGRLALAGDLRLQPGATSLPVPPPGAAHREPIYFLPEGATLTPGAKAKLLAWVTTWGRAGRWVLAQPPGPATPLSEARLAALREELGRLGVSAVEVATADPEPPGKYPAVFVLLNPC